MAKYRIGQTAYALGDTQPDQTLNPAIDRLWDSAAGGKLLTKTLAGDLDLTRDEVQANGVLLFDGSPGAAVTVDFPPTDAAGGWHGERLVYVVNATADTQDITFRFDNDANDVADGNTVTVSPGMGAWLRVQDPDVDREPALDLIQLPQVGAADGAADYGVVWDASARGLRRLLLDDWPGSGGSGGGTSIVAGAWDTLGVQEVSGSLTELEFELPSTGYVAFLLTGWLSHDDSVSTQRLFLRLSDDGGATWIATGYDWAANDWRSDGGSHIPRSGANDAQIVLAHWSDHDTHNGFEVFIQAALDAGQPTSLAGSMYRHAAAITSVAGGSIVARQRTAGAHDRLKLFFDGAAQIDGGKVALIGLKSQPESIAIGGPRGALIKLTAAQSIPSAAWTVVDFDDADAEIYDTDAFHDTAANQSRLTVPAGVTHVRLAAGMDWATDSNGNRLIQITRNGAAVVGAATQSSPGHGANAQSVETPVLEVVAGDYFELQCFQNAGVALDAEVTPTDGGGGTYFAIEVVERTLNKDFEVAASADPSGVAAVDFLVESDFDYEIEGRVLPGSDAADALALRCSTDGGAGFDSTGGNYHSVSQRVNEGSSAVHQDTALGHILLHGFFVGGAAGEGVEFRIRFTKPSDSAFEFLCTWEVAKIGGANDVQWQAGAGIFYGGNGVDAVRLLWDGAADFGSGHITLRRKARS